MHISGANFGAREAGCSILGETLDAALPVPAGNALGCDTLCYRRLGNRASHKGP